MADNQAMDETAPTSAPISRARRGRWLGGVCAGLAAVRGWSPAAVRLAFVLAALAGGLGAVVYLACWLIMPAQGDGGEQPAGSDGVVLLALACAAGAGLLALAAVGALATAFGFGWVVLGIAALVLAGLLGVRRLGIGWALLPVAALTLPAVAVAMSDVRLAPQAGQSVSAPASARALPTYRSGLGTLMIDLRHTTLPASGSVPLRIEAGVRRTIVALPFGRCVRVHVSYRVDTFAVGLATLFDSRRVVPFSDVVLFGRLYGTRQPGVATSAATRAGPTLDIDFSSQGGSLYVRDYPDTVDPEVRPDWPGYPVHLEPRPRLSGEPRKLRPVILRAWHRRLAAERTSARVVSVDLPGPCA